MAFKMKGPSLYKNGALGKNLNVQKDYAGQADGRATSSPLQQTEKQKANLPKEIVNAIAKKKGNSPLEKKGKTMAYQKKTKEDYMKDGFNQTDADKMMKDGAVTGVVAGGGMGKKLSKTKNRNMIKKMGKKLVKESTTEASNNIKK
jgi:hypothetical protein